MVEKLEIRRIKFEEISKIGHFPPKDWKMDLPKLFNDFYFSTFFYPVVAIIDDRIVGTGNAFVNKDVAWLGNIIVDEQFRGNGIGRHITQHLIDYTKSRNVKSINLAATKQGLPVYQKLGFELDENYLFYKSPKPFEKQRNFNNILMIKNEDFMSILNLDYKVTGEFRDELIIHFMSGGYKYFTHELEGFYLPRFGNGLIICKTDTAGIELLKLRLSINSSPICIPQSNFRAKSFLEELGYSEYLSIPRMYLIKRVNWKPEGVFSRGSGYLG